MKFSKTTEYAIRVMVFLSDHRDELYSVNRMHSVLNISYKYLGRLMSKLAAAGLVEVLQGKQGGFRINRSREPIYLYQVIEVVEGLGNYQRCVLGFKSCSSENPCSLHQHWLEPLEKIKNMIYEVDLRSLSEREQMKY